MKTAGAFSIAGEAEAEALVLTAPLSFWGGIDVATGMIIDRSHPQKGRTVAGRMLVMEGGRGSSSSSSVLAEAIRRGTAPAGILLGRPDPILTVGAIVARTLYSLVCPIIVGAIDSITTGERLKFTRAPDGVGFVETSEAPR